MRGQQTDRREDLDSMNQAKTAAWPATGKSTGVKATAVSAIAALAVTGAVLYPGFETADADLNDGGVWVVNQAEGKIAHLNYQSRLLDGGVVTPLFSYDLAQRGETVLLRNGEQAALNQVDTAMVQFAGDTDNQGRPLPELVESAELVFRVNRDVVVLNDVVTG
ncbi:hypothetical protein GCM10027591_13360 [Zhihengliuella somnathii]